ncbi:TetR/AcrR family transcriptional regulator C-terminal domain-containing protein [Agromyces soli]
MGIEHRPRGSGRGATRERIMAAAARLLVDREGQDPSVADIAREAGVFPSQITYHFGSKDALLVHAAFLALLRDAARIERFGATARDADAFRRSIARAVVVLPSLPRVAGALANGITRPELAEVVDTHLKLLFRQSERYLERVAKMRGWAVERPIPQEVRTFWTATIGAALLVGAGATGTAADLDLAGILTVSEPAGR